MPLPDTVVPRKPFAGRRTVRRDLKHARAKWYETLLNNDKDSTDPDLGPEGQTVSIRRPRSLKQQRTQRSALRMSSLRRGEKSMSGSWICRQHGIQMCHRLRSCLDQSYRRRPRFLPLCPPEPPRLAERIRRVLDDRFAVEGL